MHENSSFKSVVPIQVRFSDIDMMGHVSNIVYQSYYDAGKVHYFDRVLPDMDYINVGLVGASVKIDYLKPIYMRSRIYVESHVVRVGSKSITMNQSLVDEETGEVLSTCSVVLVCFDVKQQISMTIPERWKQRIVAFDGEAVFA